VVPQVASLVIFVRYSLLLCKMETVLRPSFAVTSVNGRVTWPVHVVCFLWRCVLAKIYATATYKQLLPSGARPREVDVVNCSPLRNPPFHSRTHRDCSSLSWNTCRQPTDSQSISGI